MFRIAAAFAQVTVATILVGSTFVSFTSAASPQRRELADRRTEKSVTYANPDGSFTTSLFAEPINYRDRHGDWQPIRSELVPAQEAGYAYRNAANSFDALFRDKSTPGYLRLQVAGKHFDLGLDDAASSTSRASGDQIVYPDVLGKVDLRYAVASDGLKETLVLADASAPTHYRFTLTPPADMALSAKRLPNGAWVFVAPGRRAPLFELTPPRVDEAAVEGGPLRGGPRGPKSAVDLKVTRADGKFALELTVDSKWLLAPQRRFPVLLDPTIKIEPPQQTGNFIGTCATCSDMGSPLWIGTDETDSWRAAVQFDLSDLPPQATVSAATLGLWNDATDCVPTSSYTCGDNSHTINVHRMTKPWDTVNTTTNQLGWDSLALSSYSLAAHAASGWMSWDVKSAVQGWVSGTQPNYGLLLKRSTEPLNVGGPAPPGADATDPTQAPKLDITYTSDAVKLYKPETLHSNGAELSWTKYSYPDGHAFSAYEIHRSPTPNFTPSASTLIAKIGDPSITTYRDTTAAAGKTFTYKIVVSGWPSYEQTVTLPADGYATKTLQLGPGSNGTYLASVTGDPNCSNYGADDEMWIGDDTDDWTPATNWLYRPLVQFDVRDIPTTATISNATLSLHTDVMPPAQTVTVNVHRVTSSWQEGTGLGDCTGDGASWNETEAGVKWKAPGGDYDPTVVASKVHYASDVEGWDNFNVASAVQKWVSGQAPNLGLLLKFANETPVSGNWFAYAGDDYSYDQTWRPKLSLTYTDGSHANGPIEAVSSPGPGDLVNGAAVNVTAVASDDNQVKQVDFLVDGQVKATDTTAPYSMSWNTTALTNASHSVTARATDDAGNVTTSPATSVTVDNTAPPTTSVTAPAGAATVSGSAVNVTASATGGEPISRVEFFVDGNRLGDDTTAPYGVTWNTLDTTVPSYDGAHTLTTKAYDSAGRVATSSNVAVTTANTAASKFKAGFTSTEVPQSVIYDPSASVQDKTGVDVTITNNSALAWSAADVVLRYRWYSPDSPSVVTTGADVPLTADLSPAATTTLRVLADPPVLPDGVDKSQYRLQFDLYSKTSAAYFADKGNKPLENPVIVNKALVRDALGIEQYYRYDSEDVGAGMQRLVNIANGNSLLQWEPLSSAGRGLDTTVDLTYNALEKKCECQAGNNWSLAVSSLTRLGLPIDVHPNKADTIAGRSNKYIEFTDADGTTHTFTSRDGVVYQEPAGVHLFLRKYSDTDSSRKWALTEPDRTTYFYDVDGYPTSVQDKNGNALTFTESPVANVDDPGGPSKHVTAVTDAGGRSFAISYWTKADNKKPQVRGKVKRIADHLGHALDFDYYEDGNLLQITQRGGTNADGSFLADRRFVFTYTTSDGSGPAIPLAANRVNPDPKTPNESTRIFSVRDPRGTETTFAYLGPGYGTDRWKLASSTDRAGNATTYAYDTVKRVTTVTAPLGRATQYAYDTDGKLTALTNAKQETTTFGWSGDRMLTKITEPTGNYVQTAYNDNGLPTDVWDQLRNHTLVEYDSFAVDGSDVSTNWPTGRTIPHVSQVARITSPNGTATAASGDYQTQLFYDTKGNLTKAKDPMGFSRTLVYNADGTVSSSTDANGHTTTFPNYDANGLPTKTVDAKAQVTTASFDANGNLLWTQDAAHANDSGANGREYRTYFDYDSFGRLGRQSEPKSTQLQRGMLIWSATTFDANDNVVGEVRPFYAADYDPAGALRSTVTYDAMDRPTQETSPDKTADPAGARTQYVYDAAGRVTQTTFPRGVQTTVSDKDFAVFYTYDALDRAVKETQYAVDGTGSVTKTLNTHYCYDLGGDLRWVVEPKANLTTVDCTATTPPAYTTKSGYDVAHELTSTTDELGRTSSETYDANGNVATETDTTGATTTYTYDQRDAVAKEVHPYDTSVTPSRLLTTLYEYDGGGNLKREVSPRAYDASPTKTTFTDYVTAYQYDELDRLVRIDLPTSAAYPQAQYVHMGYDANDNVKMETLPATSADPNGVLPVKKTNWTYFDTGQIESAQTPHLPKYHYDYTPDGQQSLRIPETPSGALDPTQRMTWTYTPSDLVQSLVDRAGQSASYGYDADGNLTSATESRGLTGSQVSRTVLLGYDGFDQLMKARDKAQSDTNYKFSTYSYDDNGQVVHSEENGVEDPNGATLSAGRKYDITYDQSGGPTSQVDFGPTSAATDDVKTTISYYPSGDPQTTTVERGDGAGGWQLRQTSTATYFADENLKTMTTKNGAGTTIESHTLSYLDPNGIYDNGNRTSDTFTILGPNAGAPCRSTACTVAYEYNPRDQLVKEATQRGATASSTKFTLDSAGNVTTIDRNGDQTTYTYSGDQMTTRTHAAELLKYTYDADGNLDCVTRGASSSKSDCNTAQGTPVSPNLVTDYAYDYLNRLWSVRSYNTNGTKNRTTDYVYDAFDRLAQETESHGTGAPRTTVPTYNSTSSEVVSEQLKDGNGAVLTTRNYSYDDAGEPVTLAVTPAGASTKNYEFGFDPHGDVSELVDAGGQTAADYVYDAYGNLDSSLSGGDTNEDNPTNPIRYAGLKLDSGSATTSAGDRHFDSADAHFLQEDQFNSGSDELDLTDDGTNQNRYALGGADPVNFEESDGHSSGPITIEHTYHGKQPKRKYFAVPILPDYHVVRGGFFIKKQKVTLFGSLGFRGDDRGFNPNASPLAFRAFFRLNYVTGVGYMQVNPTCRSFRWHIPFTHFNRCARPNKIQKGSWLFAARSPIHRRNFLATHIGGDNTVGIKVSLTIAGNLPRFIPGGAPAISAGFNVAPRGVSKATGYGRFHVWGKRDAFPSFELYHKTDPFCGYFGGEGNPHPGMPAPCWRSTTLCRASEAGGITGPAHLYGYGRKELDCRDG